MTDWFHKALKAISYNRYAALGLVIGIALFVPIVGCQFTDTSPFTGEKATKQDIIDHAQDYAAEAKLTEEQAFADYQATVAHLKLEGEQKARAAQRAIDRIETKEQMLGQGFAMIGDAGEAVGGPTGSALMLASGLLMNLFGGGALVDAARRKVLVGSIFKPAEPTTPTTPTPTA